MKLSVIIPVYNQEGLIYNALKSIPDRDDIEAVVINDGSTDLTSLRVKQYIEEHKNLNIIFLENKKNMGVSYSLNRGLDIATGEYLVILGSDDDFIPDKLNEVLEHANGEDLVYFDLITNDGTIFEVTNDTKYLYCGSVKLMRRDFVGDTRNLERYASSEDHYFFGELQAKNPTEIFTNIIAKHYNFPRVNSLSYNQRVAGKVILRNE